MLLSDTIVDFHLFYDGAVDIQIWALLTRSRVKSLILRWPFRPVGLLFLTNNYMIYLRKRNWNNIFHLFENYLNSKQLVFFFRHFAVRRQLNFKQNIYLPQYDKFLNTVKFLLVVFWGYFVSCHLCSHSLMFTLINILSKSTDLTPYTSHIETTFLISVKGCCHQNGLLLNIKDRFRDHKLRKFLY